MGVKKKAAEHGDRARWGDLMGTIIDLHASKTKGLPGPSYSVLPDAGPKHLQLWPKDVTVVLDDRPTACPRCGVIGHRAQSCQVEYLAWKEQQAQQPSPQPDLSDWDVDF